MSPTWENSHIFPFLTPTPVCPSSVSDTFNFHPQLTIILSLSWIFFLLPILLLVTKFVFLYSSTMLAWSINMNQKALYHLGHSPNLLWICEGFVYLRNPTFNIPINPTQTTLIEIDVLQKTICKILRPLFVTSTLSEQSKPMLKTQAQLLSQWNFVVTIKTALNRLMCKGQP